MESISTMLTSMWRCGCVCMCALCAVRQKSMLYDGSLKNCTKFDFILKFVGSLSGGGRGQKPFSAGPHFPTKYMPDFHWAMSSACFSIFIIWKIILRWRDVTNVFLAIFHRRLAPCPNQITSSRLVGHQAEWQKPPRIQSSHCEPINHLTRPPSQAIPKFSWNQPGPASNK